MTHEQHSRLARVASEPMTARAHTSRQRQALVLTATVALLLASASAVTAQAAPLRLNAFVSHLTIRPSSATHPAPDAVAAANRGPVDFRTVDIPGASGTAVNGVSDRHVLLGTYFGRTGATFGFIEHGHRLIRFNYPGTSGATMSSAINDGDTAVGSYTDDRGVSHGWIRSAAGAFSQIDDPSAGGGEGQGTAPQSINSAGMIVGSYTDAGGVNHGFVDTHGRFATIDVPAAGTAAGEGTVLGGVNDLGVITGDYVDAEGVAHGFVKASGSFVEIDAPGAGTMSGEGTLPAAISNKGTLDGAVINASGAFNGWLLDDRQFIPVNEPSGGGGTDEGTNPLNLSPNGSVACGVYAGSDDVLHGFVATVPSALPVAGNGLVIPRVK